MLNFKPSSAQPGQYQSQVCPVLNEHFFGWTAIAWLVALIRANHQQRPSKIDSTSSCAIDTDTWIFDPSALTEINEDDNWVLDRKLHEVPQYQ
jgi:hypothetical protein